MRCGCGRLEVPEREASRSTASSVDIGDGYQMVR